MNCSGESVCVCACVRACVRAADVSNLMFLYRLQRSCETKDVSEYELRREKKME